MMIMKNDNNKRRVKKPLLPTSHHTLCFSKQQSSTGKQHFTSTPSLLVSVACNCQRQIKVSKRRTQTTTSSLYLWVAWKLGWGPNSLQLSTFPQEHTQGWIQAKLLKENLLCTHYFRCLHYLLGPASCKAAVRCLGPLHTSGLRKPPGAQVAPLPGDDGATEPRKCLFWPDLTFPELPQSHHLREGLSRPLKSNTSSSWSLKSAYPWTKV